MKVYIFCMNTYIKTLIPPLPDFIKEILGNRNFNISDSFEQEMGVPRGSILSVTLFSIIINSLAVLRYGMQGSLYVNDLVICYKSKKHEL